MYTEEWQPKKGGLWIACWRQIGPSWSAQVYACGSCKHWDFHLCFRREYRVVWGKLSRFIWFFTYRACFNEATFKRIPHTSIHYQHFVSSPKPRELIYPTNAWQKGQKMVMLSWLTQEATFMWLTFTKGTSACLIQQFGKVFKELDNVCVHGCAWHQRRLSTK